jgi:hypothetical protein
VVELAERFQLIEVTADPWHAGVLLLDLKAGGIWASEYPKSDSRMTPASERVSAAILEQAQRLKQGGACRSRCAPIYARRRVTSGHSTGAAIALGACLGTAPGSRRGRMGSELFT